MILELPFPPLLNRLYNNIVVHGHAMNVLSPEGAQWKDRAGWLAREQMGAWLPYSCALSLSVRLFRARDAGDWDGPMKILCDSLQGIVYENDKQLKEVHVYVDLDREHPRVVLDVEPLRSEQPATEPASETPRRIRHRGFWRNLPSVVGPNSSAP